MNPEGVLVIDKPPGMTSHDVVDAIRRRFHTKKVGHAGTLDPDATGVLVLGLGRATRLLAFTQGAPKRYVTRARFGVTTSTQDASGEVLEQRPCAFGRDDLEGALVKFTGDIEQIPPMVSAVKVGGERLYKKARRGEDVERPARSVTIYELRALEVSLDEYEAELEVVCSGGTYIRTLVHDIGELLGCGAHLTTLRRTESGGFTEAEAVALDDVGDSHLRPLSDAVRGLPRVDLDDDGARDVSHGRAVTLPADPPLEEGERVAVFHDGRVLGVYVRKGPQLAADKVLAS